jgi:hypothetical protein
MLMGTIAIRIQQWNVVGLFGFPIGMQHEARWLASSWGGPDGGR